MGDKRAHASRAHARSGGSSPSGGAAVSAQVHRGADARLVDYRLLQRERARALALQAAAAHSLLHRLATMLHAADEARRGRGAADTAETAEGGESG